MEMKSYQKQVISDLTRYLELINEHKDMPKAFTVFWNEKHVPVGNHGVTPYQNLIPQTPHVCFKVPTGGGKTFLACNSIKPVFDALPPSKAKVVVWLVPSDTILEQTFKNLSNPEHPYRQRIDVDFGSRVEVYTKQQLMNGQNFTPSTVSEQLSVLVLSYDSFRTSNKEGRLAFRENGNLYSFIKSYGPPEVVVDGADETALLQTINCFMPFVIVDESHHSRSVLSIEMLKAFNPRFILDLTATPRAESNIISFVNAAQLKRENMVKLPFIVYNRESQGDVLVDAIDLRCRLEIQAIEELKKTGSYIRPIVLFQAQPKGKEDSTTFLMLKKRLISEAGIPSEEIAIKTADVNELRDIDLSNKDCKIRYIITVNALKEGWDCPHAYILATLANKTSSVDVEQILGRILRQPHVKKHEKNILNMSFVLTSSNDFKETLSKIVKGLNNAGFSSKDCRIAETTLDPPMTDQKELDQQKTEGGPLTAALTKEPENQEEDFLDFNGEKVGEALNSRKSQPLSEETLDTGISGMLANAEAQGVAYDDSLNNGDSQDPENLPPEVKEKMRVYRMNLEYVGQMEDLLLPQFYLKVPGGMFADDRVLLKCEHLIEDFTLKGKPYDINIISSDETIFKVDVDDSADSTPKYMKMSTHENDFFKDFIAKLPEESQIAQLKSIVFKRLDKINYVENSELREYVDRIIGDMRREQIAALMNSAHRLADKIKQQVEILLSEHYAMIFKNWLEQGRIICAPSYRFPDTISPLKAISIINKSLYSSEQDMNDFEFKVVTNVAALPNVLWWHRNISRVGFYINGFINHYPDLIVMTDKGHIILIETKGDHLENPESKQRLEVGRAWNHSTDTRFRYFMVFQSKDPEWDGAYPYDEFMKLIGKM